MRSHITGASICYGHRRVSVVRSHITGGTICYGQSACVCCEHMTEGTIVTSIGVCMLALPGPGPKMRTSTWFQTQTFNAFNLQTLTTYKPSNSQTLKLYHVNFQCIQSSNSYNLQAFKFPNSQTLPRQLSMHSIFKLLQLTSLQTPKLSNFKNFKHWNSTSLKLSKF